jgi:hypothetical protein
MKEFIEQCRTEWRRIGVAAGDVDELAGELAADLAAAAADGVSLEGFLGDSAADPRRFAAAWAAERGLIPAPDGRASGVRSGRAALIAFAAIAAVVFVGAALLLATGEPKVTLLTAGRLSSLAGGSSFAPPPSRVLTGAAAPIEWVLLAFSALALAFCAWQWSRRSPARRPEAVL